MATIELETKKTEVEAPCQYPSFTAEQLKSEIKKAEIAYEKGLYLTHDEMKRRHPRT